MFTKALLFRKLAQRNSLARSPVTASRKLNLLAARTAPHPESGALLPGHVWAEFTAADLKLAHKLLPGSHPLHKVIEAAIPEGTLTAGHAPGGNDIRKQTDISREGIAYANVEAEAVPWHVRPPQFELPGNEKIALGDLAPEHMEILLGILERLSGTYSLGGKAKPVQPQNMSYAELLTFLSTHVAPSGALNCCDVIADILERLADYEGKGKAELASFKYRLQFCTRPQEQLELAKEFFRPDYDGRLSFGRLERSARQDLADAADFGIDQDRKEKEEQSVLAALKKALNYDAFRKAAGLDVAVFDRMALDLVRLGLIFQKIFETKADERWGTDFFGQVGKRLKDCQEDQGVAAVCYYKNTYPGDITHLSAIAFSPSGEVSISHHESITVKGGTGKMVDGLAPFTVGIPSGSYDTKRLHDRISGRDWKSAELPIAASYAHSGPPMVQFTVLRSFTGMRQFNQEMADAGASSVGIRWLYGVDPNHSLAELAAGVKAGKVVLRPADLEILKRGRFQHEPMLSPPGARNEYVPGLYTNNCARLTLLALLAGGSVDLRGIQYSEEMDLAEVAEILFNAGLMPNTDPALFDRMRAAGSAYDKQSNRVETHTGSFLALGRFGWSNAKPETKGAQPPHVARNPLHDQKADDAARKAAEIKLGELVQKNKASFDAIPR
ncbi:MAG: hypothetical protein WKG52_06285 [Variovorax sp.]